MILRASAVAVCCSHASSGSRRSRATSVSWLSTEEPPWRTAFRVFALWPRALASLLLAMERRRIAPIPRLRTTPIIKTRLQQGFAACEMGFRAQFAQQQSFAAHVRFGSFATDALGAPLQPCPLCPESDVRPPKCDRSQWAKSGCEQVQQPARYSITLSAVASSVCGTVRPSALAVFRLMESSNLVGCSTGISPGLAPRSILSTISAVRRN
jgi:hypothetical protein